jgi:hypothetical protein
VASSAALDPPPIPQDEVGRPVLSVLSELAANRGRGRVVPAADGHGQPLPLPRREHPHTLGDARSVINTRWHQVVETRCVETRTPGSAGGLGKRAIHFEWWRAPARPDSFAAWGRPRLSGCRQPGVGAAERNRGRSTKALVRVVPSPAGGWERRPGTCRAHRPGRRGTGSGWLGGRAGCGLSAARFWRVGR